MAPRMEPLWAGQVKQEIEKEDSGWGSRDSAAQSASVWQSDPALPTGEHKQSTHTDFNWENAIPLLKAGRVQVRPSRISDHDCIREQVFLENPVLKRRKGDDKWMTSGGRKGASELWAPSGSIGVLKRYGRVVRKDLAPLRFAQYTMLMPDDAGPAAGDMKARAIWVVQPLDFDALTPGSPPQQATAVISPGSVPRPVFTPVHEHEHSTMDVLASSKFISFQSTASGEEGLELGSIKRKAAAGGVTLQSSQGDFAEWYEIAAGQAPFEEGDVVGFRRGKITRRTSGCAMLGVVSRKAVVEGSAPPPAERHLYDTVAHCGVVPVKLSVRPRDSDLQCECPAPHPGQLLTPSGRHDGTAVLAPATESVPRVGILLDETATSRAAEESQRAASRGSKVNHVLATVLVVAPTSTVPHGSSNVARQLRRGLATVLWAIICFALAVLLVMHWLKGGRGATPGDTIPKVAPPVRIPLSSWGPPSFAEINATCPSEVARCIHRVLDVPTAIVATDALRHNCDRIDDVDASGAFLSCPRELCDALNPSKPPPEIVWDTEGFSYEMEAIYGCYFSQNQPAGIHWQPLNVSEEEVAAASSVRSSAPPRPAPSQLVGFVEPRFTTMSTGDQQHRTNGSVWVGGWVGSHGRTGTI